MSDTADTHEDAHLSESGAGVEKKAKKKKASSEKRKSKKKDKSPKKHGKRKGDDEGHRKFLFRWSFSHFMCSFTFGNLKRTCF